MIVFGKIGRRGRISPAGVRKSQDFRRNTWLTEFAQLRFFFGFQVVRSICQRASTGATYDVPRMREASFALPWPC